ncbi:MAG TPA: DUF4159 domain-containing protein [Phycisphaerae bacterium]|nr:DUF4159 domain-containing protein [Phycisphaerae bacterium]
MPGRAALLVCLAFATLAGGSVHGQALNPSSVDTSIKAGIEALLAQINDKDVITYQRGTQVTSITGRVSKTTPGEVVIKVDEGGTVTIARSAIQSWTHAGLLKREMSAPHHSGPSTLVALALVTAGVETTNPKLAALLSALEGEPGNAGGTYTYALRASLWAALLDRQLSVQTRARYRKLLKTDVDWLSRAERPGGWFTYTATDTFGMRTGDHSNTQFGDLGLWAGSVGKAEVANKHWLTMSHHWLETQRPSGGWSYSPSASDETGTPSMTVAGCNSLYIAIDRYYARPGPYHLFEGALVSKDSRDRMEEIHAAITRGDHFLSLHPPDINNFQGYELFGLERLGLASGLAQVGGLDWFRHFADQVARHEWGQSAIADSFALIFLVHGQSPIWVQKLEHGKAVEDWNYYQRDLGALTRSINHTFERLCRWQRIPADASLKDLQDAPILYIAGSKPLELSKASMDLLKHYVDDGGTIFVHADLAKKKFVDSAARLFENLFAEYGWKFEALPAEHPLYHCHFGGATTKWKRQIPLRAMSDGARLPVILCAVDLAGAWQQERGGFEDLSNIMANVRVYCAPPYAELPRVTRENVTAFPPAAIAADLTIARMTWGGASGAHPLAWARHIGECWAGTRVRIMDAAAARSQWKSADIVHLAVSAPGPDEALIKELRAYAEKGGLVLLDAVDGQAADIAALREAFDHLDVGDIALVGPTDPLITGEGLGVDPLIRLEVTESGVSLGKSPPLLARVKSGRPVVVACPFDLTAGMSGLYVWNRVGYRTASTQKLVRNILAWRVAVLKRPAADGNP